MTKFSLLGEYAPGREAAESIGCCQRTLTRYAGELGSEIRSVKVGGRRYYRRDDLKRWLQRRERQAPTRRCA